MLLLGKFFIAETDDILPGDDADEAILIVHHRDVILVHSSLNQILHSGVHVDGLVVVAPWNTHDGDILHGV